jgi:beta-aspartyl-dipeptidase (metallo-type)
MYLIKNAEVYAPKHLGKNDVLVGGSSILALSPKLDVGDLPVEVIEATGLRLVPGFIDLHAHIAGAGGEGGPSTRTSEIQIQDLLEAGVTTVIGCLGTDGVTRKVESVLMKAKGLVDQGLSSWIYTGAYQIPTPTIFENVGRDLALIQEVIGVGEVAIADHRSTHPTTLELIKLAKEARVGGMLGGKAGIVHFHMGDTAEPFKQLYEMVEQSELKFSNFLPTHCNRNFSIFEDSKKYGQKGYVDLTTSSYPYFPDEEVKPSKGLAELLKAGVPIEHITFSSDSCGSLPVFDKNGEFVRSDVGKPQSLLFELRDSVNQEKLPLETALQVITSTPARILKLKNKGQIKIGFDADLVFLDPDFKVSMLLSKGIQMQRMGK